MKAGMQKYIEMCIIKKHWPNFKPYMKINRNTTQAQKRKQKEI